MTSAPQGAVGLLFHHLEPDPDGSEGLVFAPHTSASSPNGISPMWIAAASDDPVAVTLARGYDAPPVAINHGYLAMLALWDEVDTTSGAHALRLAVGATASPLSPIVGQPDGLDLACAGSRISAGAVRAGSSWLIAASSGSALMNCGSASPGPPSSLVLDRIAWGAPDTIAWTIERTFTSPGTDPIESIRMIPVLKGGFLLVQRKGHAGPDRFRVDAQGSLHEAGALAPVDGAKIVVAAVAAVSNGILTAHVDEGAPRRVHLELRDHDDVMRATAVVEAAGAIESLSMLESKDEGSVLLGWATTVESGGRLQVARVGCQGGT